ncbi:hypothetical protein M758_10G137800 [Ceratodon purpureus]|nr:hypothetical protein M758_10G137800 [Ceratodon purpureus]
MGFELPKEIIAVVRPRFTETIQMNESNQRNIVDKALKMHLEVKILDFVPGETSVLNASEGARVVYNEVAKASTKEQMQGLYCFNTKGNQLEHLFTQMGTYMFHFSLVGSKYGDVPPSVLRVNVAPNNVLVPGCQTPHIQRRKHLTSGHDTASQIIVDDDLDEEDADMPLHPDKTIIHVTTLDELVQVNTWFAIAIFLGYAFSPPLPSMQVSTSLAPPRPECYVTLNVYRNVVYWEIVSFGFFLFSTMVAHGFKLLLVLG